MATKKKAPSKKAPSKKGPAKKKGPVRKRPVKKSQPAAEAETTSATHLVHGVPVAGDARKGGTSKSAITAVLGLDQITVDKGFNPRTAVGDIDALQKSIKAEGLLSSLVVRPGKTSGKFRLVAGERRLRALEALGHKGGIPCIIRVDLTDDDDRARAVALAENSEDGRTNLNPIEIGRVAKELTGKSWTIPRIANETGLNHQRIRRCLALMDVPTEIQEKVASKELALTTALEYAKLDEDHRARMDERIDEGTTAADIKRIRKEIETESAIEEAAEDAVEETGSRKKAGKKKSSRVVTAWRSATEKQAQLQRVCYELATLREQGSEPYDVDFLVKRTIAAMLLWDRGDLSDSVEFLPFDDATATSDKKALAVFWKIVNAEASKHEPEEEAEEIESEEEAEEYEEV